MKNDVPGALPTSLQDIFAYVTDFAQHLFAFPVTAFAELRGKSGQILLRLKEPVGQDFIEALRTKVLESIHDFTELRYNREQIRLDIRGSVVSSEDTRALTSYFACPIAVDEKTSAVLAFGSYMPAAFSASSVQLVGAIAEHYSRFLSTVNATVAEVKHRAEIQVAEEKLRAERQLVAKLQKLDELKSGFISVVSHELRTPMTAVRSSIELVVDGTAGPVTDQQRKWLDMALRNIDRLSNLINDVLDMARIEQGRLKLDLQQNHLKPITEEVAYSLQNKAAEKKDSIIVKGFEQDIDCYCDRDAIVQVLMNLVGNAIHHNAPGITVTISLDEVNDTLATITVTDDGKGIPPEELPRIFDKFYQIQKSVGHGGESTGLGLAISKGIIETHGGKLWCESRLGKGCRFSFNIPRSPAAVGKMIRRPRPQKDSEILFGKLAILLGYAREDEVETCVKVQSTADTKKNLGDIMVEEGVLTEEQRSEVLNIQRANLNKPHPYDPVRTLADVILGRLAIKFKYLNQEQVNECVRIQATRRAAGKDALLGEVFVELGYLPLSRVIELLSLQGITVMSCPECGQQSNVFYYSPANEYKCVGCGALLEPLEDTENKTPPEDGEAKS